MFQQISKQAVHKQFDKENKSEVCNINLELSQKFQKSRSNQISHQYLLPQQQLHLSTATENNLSLLSKTEENIKDLLRPNNAEKVKKSLTSNLDHLNYQSVDQQVPKNDLSSTNEINISKNMKMEPKQAQNQLLLQSYGNQIMSFMIDQEKTTTPQNCLSRHNIPINLRAKMIDWMVEVLSSYKCTEQSFFMAQRIMDGFFQKTKKVHEIGELHLVGVTSMFIACKYEEIYPMKLQVVHDKIAHKKLSMEQIKLKESDILQTLNFELVGATPFELSMHALRKSSLRDILDSKIYAYLEKICVYLSKMVLYDYDLISNKSYSLLSGSLIFVAFKIIEQIDQGFKAEDRIKQIVIILELQYDVLIETAAKILALAKNFDKLYPNLENLKKFNGFSLDDVDKKKLE